MNLAATPTPIFFAIAQSIDLPHKGEGEEGVVLWTYLLH